MNHIYAVQNTKVANKRRREIVVSNIQFLRKIEHRCGESKMIEERIAKNVETLHTLWFGPAPSVSTSKQ
jgi:hypothetical protein